MRNCALFVALMSMPAAALAATSTPIVATNAERETGFRDLGECQKALEGTRKASDADGSTATGSLFNQAQGNVTRCEVVGGEVLAVVYPRGHAPSD